LLTKAKIKPIIARKYNKEGLMYIIIPGALGDGILALPLLRQLKNLYPQAKFIARSSRALFTASILGVKTTNFGWKIDDQYSPARSRYLHMKLAVFSKLQRTGIIEFEFPGGKLGIKRQEYLYGASLRNVSPHQHISGFFTDFWQKNGFQLIYPENDGAWIAPTLPQPSLPEKTVAVCLGHNNRQERLLPRGNWIRILETFREAGFTPVYLPFGREESRNIARLHTEIPGIVMPDLTLDQLATALAAAQLAVGNDCGPMHLAAAVGTPNLTFFHATRGSNWHPLGKHSFFFQSPNSRGCHHLEKSHSGQCSRPGCHKRHCLPCVYDLQKATRSFLHQNT